MTGREDPRDVAAYHAAQTMTAGAAAYHGRDPRQALEALEAVPEDHLEQWVRRDEAYNGLMEWVFAAGPDPRRVARRLGQLAKLASPALVACEAWWPKNVERPWDGRGAEVEEVLRGVTRRRRQRYGGGAAGDSQRAWQYWESLCELGRDTVRRVMRWWWAAGPTPVHPVRRVLGIAKASKPWLVHDMSLEEIAVLGLDGGRATVSARVMRDYNGTIEEHTSAKIRAPFQKTFSAAANMAAAQKGNTNRKTRPGRRRAGNGKHSK